MRQRPVSLLATIALAAATSCISPVESPGSTAPELARREPLPLSASPDPSATPAQEWIRHEIPAHGFGLSLPPSWRRVEALVSDRTPDSRFIAADVAAPASPEQNRFTAPVVEVITIPFRNRSNADPADFARELASLATASGIKQEVVDLPFGKAVLFRYRDVLGNGLPAEITRYTFARGATVYEVVFGVSPEHAEQYGRIFDRIIRSFTVL